MKSAAKNAAQNVGAKTNWSSVSRVSTALVAVPGNRAYRNRYLRMATPPAAPRGRARAFVVVRARGEVMVGVEQGRENKRGWM